LRETPLGYSRRALDQRATWKQILRSLRTNFLADNLLSISSVKKNNLKSYRTGRQLGRWNTVMHVFITVVGAIQVA
jgi:hypothetical protein